MSRALLCRALFGALGLALAGAPAADPVRLLFVGDIMLDDGPGRLIEHVGVALAAFAALLAEADYTIGNLECPIASTGQPP